MHGGRAKDGERAHRESAALLLLVGGLASEVCNLQLQGSPLLLERAQLGLSLGLRLLSLVQSRLQSQGQARS